MKNRDLVKKTDKARLLELLDRFGIGQKTYYAAQMVHGYSVVDDEAIAKGAVESIAVRNHLDFSFDAKGRFVGTSDGSIKGFRRRGDKGLKRREPVGRDEASY